MANTNVIRISIGGNEYTTDHQCINTLMSMIWGNPNIDISDKTIASTLLTQLSQLLLNGDVDITIKSKDDDDFINWTPEITETVNKALRSVTKADEDVTDLARICAIKNRIRP